MPADSLTPEDYAEIPLKFIHGLIAGVVAGKSGPPASATKGQTVETASIAARPVSQARSGDKGLKSNAIGYVSNLVIGVASTAPGYSLAATLGFIVAVGGMGAHAPAIMIVSFIPMLAIASAYNYMNKADPDCGTSFTWVTRAMGPRLGWLTGWAIVAADVVVMATLAYIAGVYTFLLFGLDAAAHNTLAISIVAAVWIGVMTWICYVGIELSARTQYFLLAAEVVVLGAFCVAALAHVYIGGQGTPIELDWFSPVGIPGGSSALTAGILLGVFIYWGWDSGVCVNEESEDSANGPGRAAVMSTVLLVLIYVVVAASAQAFAGTIFLKYNADDVLSALGGDVFGSPLDKLLIVAVLTSASASTQTTILPTARTTLSMARFNAIPRVFGRIHPRYMTPDFSTIVMGAVSLLWTLVIINLSGDVLADSLTAVGFQIAFYYGLTGFACAFYYRKQLFDSVKNFVMVGLVPFAGGAMMAAVFVKAMLDKLDPASGQSGAILGIGAPVAIGVGLLGVGLVLMAIARFAYPTFFARRAETAEPGVLEERARGRASALAD
jgi:amino acid transporter